MKLDLTLVLVKDTGGTLISQTVTLACHKDFAGTPEEVSRKVKLIQEAAKTILASVD